MLNTPETNTRNLMDFTKLSLKLIRGIIVAETPQKTARMGWKDWGLELPYISNSLNISFAFSCFLECYRCLRYILVQQVKNILFSDFLKK